MSARRAHAARLALAALLAAPVLLAGRGALARGCHEVSQVVGESQCRRFGGGWTELFPPYRGGVGASVHLVPLSASLFHGATLTFSGSGTQAYTLAGRTLRGPAVAFTADWRNALYVYRGLYLGYEVEAGGGDLSGQDAFQVVDADVAPYGTTYLAASGVAGYTLPAGRFAFSAEALVGVRDLVISTVDRAGERTVTGGANEFQWLLEPRVRAEWFMTPGLSAGLYAGAELTGAGVGACLGVMLEGHATAFDRLHRAPPRR